MLELRLKALIAQEERDMIAQRTKAALAVKKAQGAELGKAGRASALANASRTKATESAVARAKELLSNGCGYQYISETLNAEGFTTSRGSLWTKQAIYRRLTA